MERQTPKFRFKGRFVITAKLKVLTGLHIGAAVERFEIGGIDNPVVKLPFPVTVEDGLELPAGCPYIPGSSLKGKMRSLLEWAEDKVKVLCSGEEGGFLPLPIPRRGKTGATIPKPVPSVACSASRRRRPPK